MKPKVSSETTAVKAARHPILDRLNPLSVIPNDWFACAGHSFAILTGPNMSGKSTYLRQVALMQVMCQMGSYLPAEAAMMRIQDALLTRLGTDDDMEGNASTFLVEMRDMAHALRLSSSSKRLINHMAGMFLFVWE